MLFSQKRNTRSQWFLVLKALEFKKFKEEWMVHINKTIFCFLFYFYNVTTRMAQQGNGPSAKTLLKFLYHFGLSKNC